MDFGTQSIAILLASPATINDEEQRQTLTGCVFEEFKRDTSRRISPYKVYHCA